jgi:hypothetical protein
MFYMKLGSRILCYGISRYTSYAKHHRVNLNKSCQRKEMINDKFSINKYFIINFRLRCTKSHVQHYVNTLIFS